MGEQHPVVHRPIVFGERPQPGAFTVTHQQRAAIGTESDRVENKVVVVPQRRRQPFSSSGVIDVIEAHFTFADRGESLAVRWDRKRVHLEPAPFSRVQRPSARQLPDERREKGRMKRRRPS